MNKKIIAGGSAALLAVGLGIASVGVTSAYFSDTNTGGHVEASLGSIKVAVDGDKSTTPVIDFANLLPGDTATGGFTVENIGRSAQDVYMTFPKEAQLKLMATLGTYAGLRDHRRRRARVLLRQPQRRLPGRPGRRPLPSELKLADGLAAARKVNVRVLKLDEVTNTWHIPVADRHADWLQRRRDQHRHRPRRLSRHHAQQGRPPTRACPARFPPTPVARASLTRWSACCAPPGWVT